ncbi:ubiquitin-conjugating enzyme E2 L5-like [Lycorma delicatula]|uniref:ubiquitin-conjugating enzyme E2 L5-like n=1 Tax=Lycorma delicatula TaxID=130591 RepID=UPI003F510181
MAATRRLQKELSEIRSLGLRSFRDIQVDDSNLLTWQGIIVPEKPPYNKGAFKIEINFPVEYPFKPPKLYFHTKIYHPNIDQNGYVCLPLLTAEHWKPATKVEQIINAIISLVNDPDPYNPLQHDIAEEMLSDHRKFMITAEAFTVKNALKRPAD